jgi:predicted CXXCH cytochrome family protein
MNTLLKKHTISRSIGTVLIGGAVLMIPGILSQEAVAGISSTKHNLGSTGTGTNKFDGTGDLCVFCHTPHGADTTASVPLWNRKLSNPATYTTYSSLGTTSLDGAVAPVGSVSIACLSCHDGTQAMNVMINAPGSGNYNSSGFTLAGNWTGPAATATPAGSLGYASIVNIGTDLRNDHPVGIQYGGGGQTSTTPSGAFHDPDFKATTFATINGNPVWWVDTGGAGRQKTDIMLYTRNEASVAGGSQPFVECASCHDPHTDAQPTFLRVTNVGSVLCLSCHTK